MSAAALGLRPVPDANLGHTQAGTEQSRGQAQSLYPSCSPGADWVEIRPNQRIALIKVAARHHSENRIEEIWSETT